MKKIITTITLSFVMCLMFLGSTSALSWSSSESLTVPSWGLHQLQKIKQKHVVMDI